MDDLIDTDIGHAVALVLVTIEEAIFVAEPTDRVQLVDGIRFEKDAVKDEGRDRMQVMTREIDIGLMKEERDRGVEDDPAVHLPVGKMGQRI